MPETGRASLVELDDVFIHWKSIGVGPAEGAIYFSCLPAKQRIDFHQYTASRELRENKWERIGLSVHNLKVEVRSIGIPGITDSSEQISRTYAIAHFDGDAAFLQMGIKRRASVA